MLMPSDGSPPASAPLRLRARSSAAVANDERIRTATVTCIGRDGYLDLSIAMIAREAGLSNRPVHDRYSTVADAAADAWTHRAGPAFAAALEELFDAVFDGPREKVADALAAGFSSMLTPSADLLAAREIIIAAPFDSFLLEAVQHGPLAGVLARCTPAGSTDDAIVRAVQSTTIVVFALGLLNLVGAAIASSVDAGLEARQLADALAAPASPVTAPAEGSVAYPIQITHEDPVMGALLTATLEEVATRSYAGATTTRIAARAGLHPSMVFSRFRTKLDLFSAAVAERSNTAILAGEKNLKEVSSHAGPGKAEEAGWILTLLPSSQLERTIALEQLRLSWHVPSFQQNEDGMHDAIVEALLGRDASATRESISAHVAINVAWGYGLMPLAALLPDAWRLPFSVVTIPLLEGPAAE